MPASSTFDVTNVIVHGYRGIAGPIEIELARENDADAQAFRDDAEAFDDLTLLVVGRRP